MGFFSKSANCGRRPSSGGRLTCWAEPLEGRLLLSATATLSGMVFHDAIQNGALDAGERRLANLKVWVDLNSNDIQDASDPSAITDSNGNYQITGIPRGEYLAFLEGKGWDSLQEDVILRDNRTTTQDFAALREQLVSGYVFEDANRDGVRQAGEAALAGITVQARFGPDESDLDDPDNSDALVGKTDSSGHYRIFVPLVGNVFAVKILPSANHRASTSNKPGGSIVEGGSSTFDLGATQSALIHCVAFDDDNDNKIMDLDSEDGIEGLRVFIDSNRNGVLDPGERSGRTDPDGLFDFGPLTPGRTYRVILVQRDKTLHTTTQLRFDVRPTLGQVVQLNFGFAPLVTISGNVFKDLDANLQQSSNEKAAGSMLVYADLNDDGKAQSTEPQATTDSSGRFTLHVLGDELCAIRIGTPGWRNSDPSKISLENMKDLLIGATQLAGIDVEVFYDIDANGTFDSEGEQNYSQLYDASSIWLDENRNGLYDGNEPSNSSDDFASRLNALQPGTSYRIGFAAPDGWDLTSKNIDRPIFLNSGQLFTLEIGVYSSFG